MLARLGRRRPRIRRLHRDLDRALGTGEVASIAVIVCLTLFYTFEGGMTAVIWTDVVQMILYVGGAVVSFFLILH